MPLWADKLLRLLYTAQAQGHEPMAKAVERIKTVEGLVTPKIVVKESRSQWLPVCKTRTWEPVELVSSTQSHQAGQTRARFR